MKLKYMAKEYEVKEINVYQKQINDLQRKINDYENEIELNKNKTKLIEITNKSKIHNQNEIINENNYLKNEINKLKSDIIKSNESIIENETIIEQSKTELNIYKINNNKLNEEKNKYKETINKLNGLINGLNIRIKQLLEENKNIKNYKIYFNANLFFLILGLIIEKKKLNYKYQLMNLLLKENINSSNKYIIYQTYSKRNSLNLEGYEKVFTGESKKVILDENENKKQVSYNNRIIFHKNLDSTLKDYITKGKDNFMFEEIFDEDKSSKDNKNNNDNNSVINSNSIK